MSLSVKCANGVEGAARFAFQRRGYSEISAGEMRAGIPHNRVTVPLSFPSVPRVSHQPAPVYTSLWEFVHGNQLHSKSEHLRNLAKPQINRYVSIIIKNSTDWSGVESISLAPETRCTCVRQHARPIDAYRY